MQEPCEVRFAQKRQAEDAMLKLPWSLEKWQIGALLQGYCLDFCAPDESSEDELELLFEPGILEDPEDTRYFTAEEVRRSCVAGEYATSALEDGRVISFLMIGAVWIFYRDEDGAEPDVGRACMCNRVVLWVGPPSEMGPMF